MKKPKIFIIVPAFNEEKTLGLVLQGLMKNGYKNLIVVDDGSSDSTKKIARSKKVITVSHPNNIGLGAALRTGFREALKRKADIAVSFDADGQHHTEDIKRVIQPILKSKADFVIGSRLKNPRGMPLHRRFGNWILNFTTLIACGVWTTDSQSGLRALNNKALQKIKIRSRKMEVSSEFFREVRRNRLRFREVPIKAIYTDYSLSKGQSHWNGFRIFFRLLFGRFR